MKGLFTRVSRKSRRLSRALVVLAVVMSAALALAWPATGKAAVDCGASFTLIAVYTPPYPSIDCDTAQYKAVNGALQVLQTSAKGYQCPATCPTLQQDGPTVVSVSNCTESGGRFNATGTAQGTYHCQ